MSIKTHLMKIKQLDVWKFSSFVKEENLERERRKQGRKGGKIREGKTERERKSERERKEGKAKG